MALTVKAAWAALGLLNLLPGLVALRPSLTERLYGVASDGAVGVLLTHRGVLFLGLAVLAFAALVQPGARRAAALVLALSMLGYLALYVRAGLPAGPLRGIATADLIGLAPLGLAAYAAWIRPPA